jgi:hypothetical protein
VASYIDQLIAFVSAHAWLAYLTLFLAALLEAVPVVGSVIPGSTIILALSALVPGGDLRLEWVLAAAIAGALLGDGSAYWLGHRAQREILSSWPLSPLGRAGGILRALRAADPRLRAGHGGRARHAATAVLPCQHRGDPAMGTGPCAAGRAGGVRAARICRPAPSCGDRETLLDTGRRRRRATGSARYLDDPPPPWRWVDRVPRTDPQGFSVRFRPATFLETR